MLMRFVESQGLSLTHDGGLPTFEGAVSIYHSKPLMLCHVQLPFLWRGLCKDGLPISNLAHHQAKKRQKGMKPAAAWYQQPDLPAYVELPDWDSELVATRWHLVGTNDLVGSAWSVAECKVKSHRESSTQLRLEQERVDES